MSKPDDRPSTPATSTPPAPGTQQAPYTQWSSQIPIDPALQQQSAAQHQQQYQHYYGHYPQAAYSHYQAQAQAHAPTPAPVVARSTVAPITAPAASAGGGAGGGMDTSDLATLNDALGSAGVDLRAEEESLQRSSLTTQYASASYRPYEDRTRKQPPKPNFDTILLRQTISSLASSHKITRIPEDSVNYLALALRHRLQELVTHMIDAAHHRTDTQFDGPASFYDDGKSPMWGILVRSDVGKQLAVLEKVEREEELRIRRERKERADMAAAHLASLAAQAQQQQGGGGYEEEEEEGPKRKKKKEGPGVTARNMSEDVRKKMSNAVASQAAGLGGKYAWMNAANAPPPSASATPKPKPTTQPPTTTTPQMAAGTGGGWAKPYVSSTAQKKKEEEEREREREREEEDNRMTVTMRDAMFVLGKERGHGGGKGAARGWT